MTEDHRRYLLAMRVLTNVAETFWVAQGGDEVSFVRELLVKLSDGDFKAAGLILDVLAKRWPPKDTGHTEGQDYG